MVRARHLGLLGLGLGLVAAACQAPDEYFRGADADIGVGQAGSSPTGAAGSFAPTGTAGTYAPTGTAGSAVTGAAGTAVSGTAGTSAGGTGGSAAGMAGTTGTAGTGAGGRGGTTGIGGAAGGAAGRGGTTGTGGAAGGAAGRGGTTGTGGAAGRGGTTGTGGRGGTTGTGGAGGGSCPTGARLDCSAAASLDLAPDGQVVDFSTSQWNTTTARFCDTHGLGGTLSSFAGTSSTAMAAVDTAAQALRLDFTVGAGQYAGGRVNFNSCVDASGFNSIQFTATATTGSLTNCAWQIQLETQDQRPTTATPAGGTCSATCERYPAATLAAATTTATTYTTRFTAFNNPAGGTVAAAGQIVGLQWQVNSGNSGAGTCTVQLRIDNIRFVTQ